ncbi:MAG: class I SAM-dependent methyltransferase [Candidatus Eremiobacteraeota bacterium]|nr:class I SAM-dependent methyltransferase [Candidatus Eremiobacteraeota bacterium]MCW5869473.1 class I SAM-dependent methyltransferase [Candidatus Eremiobacteraeota bacterium]
MRQILESPAIYLLWQGPFVRKKIAPVLRDLDECAPRRVLDVGCGPGTNTRFFGPAVDYVGVDLSPEYVDYAKRKHGRPFFVCDVARDPLPEGPFDVVLINSLMHHLDDDQVAALLTKVKKILAPEGEVQIVDLILPPRSGLTRFLALRDRGKYPRSTEHWQQLFNRHLAVRHYRPFKVGLFGIPMWELCHVRGQDPLCPPS